jgi:hypothetical protein
VSLEFLQTEAVFVGGYVLALLVIALVMEWTARFSHERIHRVKTIGFHYHAHLDAWQCSEGTFLWRVKQPAEVPVVRYHAKAEICNACRLKPRCTDSEDGRTLVRPGASWPHTEMARFQRVLSASLVLLAFLLCVVEAARQAHPAVRMPFGGGAVVCAVLALREGKRLRSVRTPDSGFGDQLLGP